ncbi:MAG: DNA-binding response regulator [Bacteroidetes bacterium HGW-Bacteroidetes-23]|nr:MAG: DNA-binding response regulator [Bacteroidetes bacterium HGW-Bacteroidetes-23]
MIKAIIIDDEQHCTDRLLSLLESFIDNTTTVVCFDTAEEAIKGIETIQPDIVFLDVQLQDKTGFDVLLSVSNRKFCLIFTTAYNQFAIEAFKFSAMDYLLKPITKEDFENAIQKAFEGVKKNHLHEQINILLSHLSNQHTIKKISIPSKEGYCFLNITEILRCEADVNYTHIYTLDKKKYTVSKPLKHFEELLLQYGFFRIHNSHLISLNNVKSYSKSGYVTLSDNTKLEVSVRRKEEFIKICNRD